MNHFTGSRPNFSRIGSNNLENQNIVKKSKKYFKTELKCISSAFENAGGKAQQVDQCDKPMANEMVRVIARKFEVYYHLVILFEIAHRRYDRFSAQEYSNYFFCLFSMSSRVVLENDLNLLSYYTVSCHFSVLSIFTSRLLRLLRMCHPSVSDSFSHRTRRIHGI